MNNGGIASFNGGSHIGDSMNPFTAGGRAVSTAGHGATDVYSTSAAPTHTVWSTDGVFNFPYHAPHRIHINNTGIPTNFHNPAKVLYNLDYDVYGPDTRFSKVGGIFRNMNDMLWFYTAAQNAGHNIVKKIDGFIKERPDLIEGIKGSRAMNQLLSLTKGMKDPSTGEIVELTEAKVTDLLKDIKEDKFRHRLCKHVVKIIKDGGIETQSFAVGSGTKTFQDFIPDLEGGSKAAEEAALKAVLPQISKLLDATGGVYENGKLSQDLLTKAKINGNTIGQHIRDFAAGNLSAADSTKLLTATAPHINKYVMSDEFNLKDPNLDSGDKTRAQNFVDKITQGEYQDIMVPIYEFKNGRIIEGKKKLVKPSADDVLFELNASRESLKAGAVALISQTIGQENVDITRINDINYIKDIAKDHNTPALKKLISQFVSNDVCINTTLACKGMKGAHIDGTLTSSYGTGLDLTAASFVKPAMPKLLNAINEELSTVKEKLTAGQNILKDIVTEETAVLMDSYLHVVSRLWGLSAMNYGSNLTATYVESFARKAILAGLTQSMVGTMYMDPVGASPNAGKTNPDPNDKTNVKGEKQDVKALIVNEALSMFKDVMKNYADPAIKHAAGHRKNIVANLTDIPNLSKGANA